MTEMIIAYLTAWLLTYLLHSTIMLGAVLGAGRLFASRFEPYEEPLLRTALFGSVVTSAVQTLLLATSPAIVLSAHEVSAVMPREAFAPRVTGASTPWKASVPMLLCAAWLLVAVARLALLHLSLRRFRSEVLRTAFAAEPALHAQASALAQGRRIPLLVSPAVSTPLVVGHRTICIPVRASQLATPELRAVLAHEMAHVIRRDPLFLALAHSIARVMFMQPLAAIATARLRALAELSCDDWALQRTSDPLALATALRKVAEWIVESPAPALAVAMATRDSLAMQRVRRILADRPHSHPLRKRPLISAAAFSLFVALVAVPGISASDAIPRPYTVRAFDDGGPFTVTLDRGVVVAAEFNGHSAPPQQIVQQGAHVRLVDDDGNALQLTLNSAGGMRWSSRPLK